MELDKRLTVRPATWRHAAKLAATMRQADRDEIWAGYRQLPIEALEIALNVSQESWTAEMTDGEIMAMWGVRPIGDRQIPLAWCLTGDCVDRYPRLFLRTARQQLEALIERHRFLTSWIDARYRGAIRWAGGYLGGFILPPSPRGPDSVPFCQVIFDQGGLKWVRRQSQQ